MQEKTGSTVGASTRSGPLAGVRVLEFAGIGPGPMCAMLLADLGAEVLRIERPGGTGLGIERPLRFDLLRRGRPSITMDLKNDGDLETVLALVERADALVEGFRPGVMERVGLGPDVCMARNRRLVYGRITGWGQTGPLSQDAGHDINYLGLTGILDAIGRTQDPPAVPLNIIGDYAGGALYLAIGILSGILHARGGGLGQVVDAGIVDGAAHLSTMFHGMVAAGMWNAERGSNLIDSGAPFYDVYRCSDGKWLAIGPLETKFFDLLLEKLGLQDAPGVGQARENWPETRKALAMKFSTASREEWEQRFAGTDACLTPVLEWSEAPRHPHFEARGTFLDIDGVVQPAPAPKFSGTPCQPPSPPEVTNQRRDEVLKRWLS